MRPLNQAKNQKSERCNARAHHCPSQARGHGNGQANAGPERDVRGKAGGTLGKYGKKCARRSPDRQRHTAAAQSAGGRGQYKRFHQEASFSFRGVPNAGGAASSAPTTNQEDGKGHSGWACMKSVV